MATPGTDKTSDTMWDVVGNDVTGNLSVVTDPPPTGYHILPGSGGPYPTKAQADAALKALQGVIANPEPFNPLGPVVKAIKAPLTGLAAIGDFFQRLTQANTWIRIGEVVLGIVLIAAGISKMTGISTVPLPV